MSSFYSHLGTNHRECRPKEPCNEAIIQAVFEHIIALRIGTLSNIAIMFSVVITNKVSNEHKMNTKPPCTYINCCLKVYAASRFVVNYCSIKCPSMVGLAQTSTSNDPRLKGEAIMCKLKKLKGINVSLWRKESWKAKTKHTK